MAIAFERMGGGFYVFIYADSETGLTLAAFDPFGCGYAAYEANGKPRLTSRKHGGTTASLQVRRPRPSAATPDECAHRRGPRHRRACLCPALGSAAPSCPAPPHAPTTPWLRAWQGDLEKIWSPAKPLKEPIELELTSGILLKFTSRLKISARLSAQGLTEDYLFGESPAAQEGNYLQKSLGVIKMGPERGKHMLDVDACRESARMLRELRELRAMKELGAKQTITTEDTMQKHPPLRPIVASTEALKASVARGEWNVEVYNSKAKMRDTLGDSLPTLRMSEETIRGANPHSKTLEGMAATNPETYKSLVPEGTGLYHGEGGDNSQKKGALPLTAVLKANSGRYRYRSEENYRTPRKRLRELKFASYDTYLKEEAPKGSMVVVCCLAGWLPQSKRMEPVLEMLNGEMHEHAKAREKAVSGTRPPDPSAAAGGPMLLCKYEMSEHRFLRDRHNINTLPMFLMYYDGKLCYANSTLNGYGTSRDDLLLQAPPPRRAPPPPRHLTSLQPSRLCPRPSLTKLTPHYPHPPSTSTLAGGRDKARRAAWRIPGARLPFWRHR